MSNLFDDETIKRVQAQNKAKIDAAVAGRDAGIERVSANNNPWMRSFFEALCRLAKVGVETTGERLRVRLTAEGLESPSHPNAWGAAITMGVRRGVLLDTGKVERMKEKKSHARRTPVYVFTAPEAWRQK